jgi:hypothetical protein
VRRLAARARSRRRRRRPPRALGGLKQRYTGKQLRQLYETAVHALTKQWAFLSGREGWRPLGRPNFQRLLLATLSFSGQPLLYDAMAAIAAISEGLVDWVAESGVISFGLILNEETRNTLLQAWCDEHPYDPDDPDDQFDDPLDDLIEHWKREEEAKFDDEPELTADQERIASAVGYAGRELAVEEGRA